MATGTDPGSRNTRRLPTLGQHNRLDRPRPDSPRGSNLCSRTADLCAGLRIQWILPLLDHRAANGAQEAMSASTPDRSHEAGQILVLAALIFVILIGIAGLAIDISG